ncbi:MAG: glycerophosphodiester phosphodiesterase [Gemmatimonadaceae bacterium]
MPRPEIIAHRGASRERPENTLAAFARAMELGADAVELDVHLHADGVVRVHHDAQLAAGAPAPPTLDEVLALLGGKLTAYCELKGPGSARGTLEAIQRAVARAAVHAFDHRQVAEARQLSPDVPRGVLEASYPVHPLEALQAVGGRDLWRHRDFVDEALVAAAHAAGARVIAWTVNDPPTMTRFAAWGVDGLCTDDVALAHRVLGA